MYLSWPAPNHREHASVVSPPHHGSSIDDARGLHPMSVVGDAADVRDDIDYVVDLTTAQGEWDPWPTQD